MLLEAGEGFVTLEHEDAELPAGESGEGLYVRLDRAKIRSVGLPAVGRFLRKLQVYKVRGGRGGGWGGAALARQETPCALTRPPTPPRTPQSTANFAAGQELYERYSAVDEHWLALREVVLANKKPRQMFVQPNTRVAADGTVELVEYEATVDGIVESFADRFPVRAAPRGSQHRSPARSRTGGGRGPARPCGRGGGPPPPSLMDVEEAVGDAPDATASLVADEFGKLFVVHIACAAFPAPHSLQNQPLRALRASRRPGRRSRA